MLSVVIGAHSAPRTSGQHVVQRRARKGRRPYMEVEVKKEEVEEEGEGGGEEQRDESSLTLMEEVLLLGLKEESGLTSIWNDCLSFGLRGCILVELALRGRLGLEERPPGARRTLLSRKVALRSDAPTGDTLLDEALRQVARRRPAQTVQGWLELLSGDTVNLLKRRWRLRNVRLRLAKGLVEKGVLTTRKHSFLLFDMTTHPLATARGSDGARVKRRLVEKVHEALLDGWVLGDPPSRVLNKRLLALLLMAHASDVLDNALDALPDELYELAAGRLRGLAALDAEAESGRAHANQMMWAVVAAYSTGPKILELLK